MATFGFINDKFLSIRIHKQFFTETRTILNRLHAQYNPDTKLWHLKINDYFEVKAWLEHLKVPYDYEGDDELKIYNYTKTDSELEIYRKETFDYSILKEGVKFYEYQKEDVELLVKRNRNFLFHEPGLGKTLEAISYFGNLYKKQKIDKIIVLAENGLLFHWRREILEFTHLFTKDDIVLIDNENKDQLPNFKDKKIFIISHHILQDIILLLLKKKMKKSDGTRLLKSKLHWKKLSYDFNKLFDTESLCLIIDECHKFKHTDTVLTKSVFSCVDSFHYRLMMSATPFITAYEDVFAQSKILDPGMFNESEESFKIQISEIIGDTHNDYAVQKRDPEKINKFGYVLQDYSLKRIKSELPEMKAKQLVKPIYFEMSRKMLSLYESIREEEVSRLREEKGGGVLIEDIHMYFPYLTQLLDNPLLLKGKLHEHSYNKILDKISFDDNPKVKYLDELLDDVVFNQNSKLVIYDTHPLTLNLLQERYKKDYGCYTIHGESDLSAEEKNRMVEEFNDPNSKCKLLNLSFLTSSSGLNLNKCSHTLVVFSLPNAPMLWKQAIDRIYRINNTRDVVIYPLLFDGTYDNDRYESIIQRTLFNDSYLNKHLTVSQIDKMLNYKYND